MTSKRRVWGIRVDASTPEIVEAIAHDHACYRVCPHTKELEGAAGVMLDKIASGELKVVEGKARSS